MKQKSKELIKKQSLALLPSTHEAKKL